MGAIERIIGFTIGTVLLAVSPAPAAPVGHSATIRRTTAEAVASERVPGRVRDTRLDDHDGRVVYAVDIQTADHRLEEVRVDAHSARVLGVHEVSDPGMVDELEAS